MDKNILTLLPRLLDTLGLAEEPMGLFYTDTEPEDGFTPKPMPTPTREREQAGEIDWQEVFGNFSCVMGNIWRARKKGTRAWFSAERFGCPGGAFWLGFMKPQTEAIINYVSTGTPGRMEGELYCDSHDTLRQVFADIDPVPAPGRYCVVQPLSLFKADEEPRFVIFFARPEILCGLHQLAFFVTNDPEVVASPWAAACSGLATWPLRYESLGQTRAVVGGWDPSARKFLRPDELSFTVPLAMFRDMVERWDQSFLAHKTWKTVQTKIAKSKRVWGETAKKDEGGAG